MKIAIIMPLNGRLVNSEESDRQSVNCWAGRPSGHCKKSSQKFDFNVMLCEHPWRDFLAQFLFILLRMLASSNWQITAGWRLQVIDFCLPNWTKIELQARTEYLRKS